MDEFFETQMDLASDKADKADSAEAEQSVKLSQGQTPTIDADVYDPKAVRDAGYPLSNPTTEPNIHTKPGARMFAGRDASNGQPMIRPTVMPDKGRPQTSAFSSQMEPIYSGLSAAENAFTVETGISKAFEQMIKYTNSLSDMTPIEAGDEANRVKWATSDRLEAIGFEHVSNSERTSEGIDDKGLDGLQMMMSAQIMRGVGDFDNVTSAIGDTGANTEQLEETWNKAVDAYNRAAKGVIQGLPTDEASALQDPRYLSAAGILNDAIGDIGRVGLAKDMDEETLRDQGMFLVDMVKGNPLFLAAVVAKAKKDPIVADALNLLLDADEGMETTMGDFGRGVFAAALDPLSYVGIGLAGRAVQGAARGFAVRQALKMAGLAGAEGAILAGSYTGIMDYGFQNIDILSGRQEEFSVSRSAVSTGIGAGAGFVFGSALSGLTTGASKLLNKWVQRKDGSVANTPRIEFSEEPAVSDNVVPKEYFAWRRELQEQVENERIREGLESAINPPEGQSSGSVGFVDDEFLGMDDLLPGDEGYLANATNELIDAEIDNQAVDTISNMIFDSQEFKGVNPDEIYDNILAAMDTITDNFHNPPDGSLESQAWLLAHGSFEKEKAMYTELIQKHRGLKVIKGGKATDAPDDPEHMAQMELVRNEQLLADEADADILLTKIKDHKLDTSEGLKKYREKFYTKVQRRILEKNDIVQEHIDAGDFRFKIDETVVSKHSGKEFRIHHLQWEGDEARYFVEGPDGEKHYMAEWGMVGGKPKLEIVSAKDEFKAGPPYFDSMTSGGGNRRKMIKSETTFWESLFKNEANRRELFEIAPSLDYEDGVLYIKDQHKEALQEYLEEIARLHEGPARDLPLSIRKGTFVKDRFKEHK